MRFADLFAGIGGFRLALEELGHECVFSCELDKFARKTYEANYDVSHPYAEDIRAVERIPGHFDLITAGFPCQDFSTAGTRKGFDGQRGGLFWELLRLIRRNKPARFLLENVPGLMQGRMLPFYHQILNELTAPGYTVSVLQINSNFCLPQNRERLYFLGRRGKPEWHKIRQLKLQTKYECDLCLRDIMEDQVDEKYYYTGEVLKRLKRWRDEMTGKNLGFRHHYKPKNTDQKSPTLLSSYSKLGSQMFLIYDSGHQGYRFRSNFGKSCTLSSAGGGVGAKTGLYDDKHNPEKFRRLTPRECARLMGFPDSFEIPVSDTQAYKQFGNAVCPPVIKYIAEVMYDESRTA